MTKEEKRSEIGIIISHLEAIMSDLISQEGKLEEIGCKRQATKIDTACGKLYDAILSLSQKQANL